ncbi:MAG TPA: LCP family protein [Candidatus Limnocylindrales bacterium]|jgi:LCP family protein required for cell wall assembly
MDQPGGSAPAASAPGAPTSTSPGRAAVLSFILPGLGQLSAGAVQRGLILAVPVLATLLVAAFFLLVDRIDLVSGLFDPTIILALVVLDVVLGIIHLVAIGDAYRLARRRLAAAAWSVRGAPRLLAGLLAATVVLHGALGAVGYQAYRTLTAVFEAPGTGYVIPPASFGPPASVAPGATPFEVSAFPGPAWAQDGRLNILLIGGDSGPGRWSIRTDTMIVMSADVATGRVALFGIPRNLLNVPLAPEDAKAFPQGLYPDLLNALWVYADGHPANFPGDDDTRGFRAITGAVQQLVGVPLDGAVVVNLNGFVDLVNTLGGLWVDVPYPIHDDDYPLESGVRHVVLDIKAGCQHLDGHLALAFARSRHQASDYQRMDRQQIVLDDLANQLDPISLIMQMPTLLDVAGTNIRTTFQPSDMGQLLRFAAQVDRKDIAHVLFDPPDYPEYLTAKEVTSIQRTVRNVFGAPGASPAPSLAPTAGPSLVPSPTPKACPPPA